MDRRQLAIGTSFSHSPLPFELRNSPRSRGPASILAWRLGQLVGGLRTISICLSRNRGDHGNRNFPHPWPPLPLFLHNFNRTLSHPHDPLSLSIFCYSRRIFPSCFSFSLSLSLVASPSREFSNYRSLYRRNLWPQTLTSRGRHHRVLCT